MKLCDTCAYRNNVEQLKPCIIYRDNCEYYVKEEKGMTREEAILCLKGIKNYGRDTFTEQSDWQNSLDMAIDALEQEPKWIPVSEKLPKDGTWNLFTDGKNVSVERYKSDAIDHFYPNGRWFSLDEAKAWMPLPEPYEEDISSGNITKSLQDVAKIVN